MLLTRCAESLNPRVYGIWCSRSLNHLKSTLSSMSICIICKANANSAPRLKVFPSPLRFIRHTRVANTRSIAFSHNNRIFSLLRLSGLLILNRPAEFRICRGRSFRYMSSGTGNGGTSGSLTSKNDLIENNGSHQSLELLSNGRFQEEVAQSLEYDSTRIDLRRLISSPADMKGLHVTLQSASRSTGDKEIMAMTIEDIQNILKEEFRRRASQTASVEIWKALLVVAGLLLVLYWGRIGKDIAGETARVTTLTLQDEQLQAKAFELANVIVRMHRPFFNPSFIW